MLLECVVRPMSADSAVIALTGSLTLGTSLKTADMRLEGMIRTGTKWLVLDLGGVTYSDSAGLGTLVHLSGIARQVGGAVRLAAVPEQLTNLLRLTRVDSLLPADPDPETSLALLRQV